MPVNQIGHITKGTHDKLNERRYVKLDEESSGMELIAHKNLYQITKNILSSTQKNDK